MTTLPTRLQRFFTGERMWPEVDRMMESFFRGAPAWAGGGGETFPLDVEETEKAYIVHANLPGVKKEGIEVTLQEGVLTIQVKEDREQERKEKSYLVKERSAFSALRTVSLPLAGEDGGVDAVFKDGVLTLTIEKSLEKQARRVTIK